MSRNTVVLAYQGLLDDGYLVARERSGYYVAEKALDTVTAATPAAGKAQGRPAEIDWAARLSRIRPRRKTSQSRWTGRATPIPSSMARWTTRCFRWRNGATARARRLGKKWLGSWTNDTWAHDDPLLVEQIRRRILPRRGIMASDDEILITLGAQNALYLLTSLLVGPDNAGCHGRAGLSRRAQHLPAEDRATWR